MCVTSRGRSGKNIFQTIIAISSKLMPMQQPQPVRVKLKSEEVRKGDVKKNKR